MLDLSSQDNNDLSLTELRTFCMATAACVSVHCLNNSLLIRVTEYWSLSLAITRQGWSPYLPIKVSPIIISLYWRMENSLHTKATSELHGKNKDRVTSVIRHRKIRTCCRKELQSFRQRCLNLENYIEQDKKYSIVIRKFNICQVACVLAEDIEDKAKVSKTEEENEQLRKHKYGKRNSSIR